MTARTKDYMHIHSETKYKTAKHKAGHNFHSAPRAIYIRARPEALLTRTDYRRIVAEILG